MPDASLAVRLACEAPDPAARDRLRTALGEWPSTGCDDGPARGAQPAFDGPAEYED